MAPSSRTLRALPYVVLAGAAGYLYTVAGRIEFHQRAGTLGPDVWPKALLALLIAACTWQIAGALLGRRPQPVEGQEPPIGGLPAGAVEAQGPPAASHPRLVAGGIAMTALYVGLIETLGFSLSTAVYLAAFVIAGGYRRWGIVAVVSLGGTLLLLFLFMKVVYVSLPPGTGPFAQLTYLLMQLMGIR
jgi:putative tricarboxylic transport membrane protein